MRWLVMSVVVMVAAGEVVGGPLQEVGVMVSHVVRQHLADCHLVLVTSQQDSPVLSEIIRYLWAGMKAGVVVEVEELLSQDHDLQQWLWVNATTTYHALIVDNTSDNITSLVRFLEQCGLWSRPEVRLMVVGHRSHVETVLLHPSLRNTVHAIYLVLHNLVLHTPTIKLRERNSDKVGERVMVYRRCLYCNNGEADVQLVYLWNLASGLPRDVNLFYELPENFMGYQFKVSTKQYFPYTSVKDPDGNERDSLDARIIHTLATLLNFTYNIREPADGHWGLPGSDGNWTGIVGDIQHQRADVSLGLTIIYLRATVVEFSRAYIDESVVILSPKPQPLPPYLSLIRPLSGALWLTLLVCIILWGVMLWLLQKAWWWTSGEQGFTFSSSLFYGWGIMLEDPPTNPPHDLPAQVFVGSWLVFCLVVTSAYRSLLISRLVVRDKYPSINTVEDLVARDGWRWGTPRMTGALRLLLSTSQQPAMQQVYKGMQADSVEKGMRQVVEGGYSFIYSKYYAKVMVAAHYTDNSGYTPVHIGTQEYPLFAGNAWVFRIGAPFRHRLDLKLQRLLEAGLITFWMDDVISTHVRHTRRQQFQGSGDNIVYYEDDGQVVLSLHHLQVTFYLLLLGHVLGLITFLLEHLLHRFC